VYASDPREQPLTFHVSGMLWKNSLVMRDIESGSLWSHILGRCVKGKLHKTQLRILPSLLTSWSQWKNLHPDSTVMAMERTRTHYTTDFYDDDTLFGYGVIVDENSKIYSFEGLKSRPLLHDEINGKSFAIRFDPSSRSALAWHRDLNGFDEPIEFEMRDSKIFDKQTGSTWDLFSGRAIAGPVKGRRLKPLLVIPTAQRAWRTFHPKTEIWPLPDTYDAANEKRDGGTIFH